MLWVTLISVALAATFYYWKKCNEVWRNKCVPQTNPLPLFGDSFYIFFKLQSIGDFVRNLTQNATGKRYVINDRDIIIKNYNKPALDTSACTNS